MGTIRAHPRTTQGSPAVTPITAVQSEYSLMERKWEADVIPLKSTKLNKKINKKYVSIIKS